MANEITLNPRKSTCIIQVEGGAAQEFTDNRINVILNQLNSILMKKIPENGVKFKVEDRVVSGYSHDPVWAEMYDRHKRERQEVEAYLDNLEKPEQDNEGTMRFPAQTYRTHRISVQL